MDKPPQHILHNGDYYQIHFESDGSIASIVRYDDNRSVRGVVVDYNELDLAVANRIKVDTSLHRPPVDEEEFDDADEEDYPILL